MRSGGPGKISVVVPARNEERLVGGCLDAVEDAARRAGAALEVVVVANRCTDATAEVAAARGATVVEDGARSIATVRNAGAAVATGDALVTVDADCRMHPDTLVEVRRLLGSGRYVGGGTKVVPERRSPGITATYALMEVVTGLARVGGGVFWCLRSDFEELGGFDGSLVLGEDVDFAKRLRAHGRRTGRRFTTIRSTPLVASCRKFDSFGDWHMFGMALQLRQIHASMRGTDRTWVDRYFYEFDNGWSARRDRVTETSTDDRT